MKSAKMGTMSIGKLLFKMSIPAMFSMLIQSLYNVVDSIFVSQFSDKAFEAVSTAFPIQTLMVGFAIGIGVGSNATIARFLGEKRHKEANKTAANGLFLAVLVYAFFLILSLFMIPPFLKMFSNDSETIQLGVDYLSIVMGFSVAFFIEIFLSRVLQATGNMIIPMISQIIGAVVNIILDPIFIFGYLGLPAMGTKGAAIATVIGQFCSMAFCALVFFTKKHDVSISLKNFFTPKWKYLSQIIRIGLPSAVMNIIGSFTTTTMNAIIKNHSPYAISILGAYFKLQSFIFMPVFGLSQGTMPILGYNYGANNKQRFMKTVKLAILSAFCIMTVGLLIFQIFPGTLLQMFNAKGEFLTQGISALRTISWCFIPAAFGIILTTMFQSIGRGFTSMMVSVLRQLGFILPVALLLSSLFGIDGVWFAYPIAEISVVVIFIPLAIHAVRKVFLKKEQEAAEMNASVTEG